MLFNFQSLYCFAIGRQVVLSLGRWTSHVQPGFHEPEPNRGLWCYTLLPDFHRLWSRIPSCSQVHTYPLSLAATYGVACCFPFLWVLRCFSSPGSPRIPMHSVCDTLAGGFPHSEICRSQPGYRLPTAFRRFQRLSSPLDAKSSTVCPS